MQNAPAMIYRDAVRDRTIARGGVRKSVGLLGVLLMATLVCGGAKPDRELKGLIQTRNFVIPAGQSATAVEDTMILASRKIEISGTLFVNPGADVNFRSPVVDIRGKVQRIPGLITSLQMAVTSMRSSLRSFSQPQPPVPETWPGRGLLACNQLTRQVQAQAPPTTQGPVPIRVSDGPPINASKY